MSSTILDPEFSKKVQAALDEVSGRAVGPISADLRLDELGLDSVSISELVLVLEDELDITLEPEELFEVETFGDLEKLIRSKG